MPRDGCCADPCHLLRLSPGALPTLPVLQCVSSSPGCAHPARPPRCSLLLPAPLQALQSVCGDLGDAAVVAALPLPRHFMRAFFLASLCVDMHQNAEALQHLQVGAVGWGGAGRGGVVRGI